MAVVCNASDSNSHYWDQLQSFSGGGLSDTLSRHRLGTAAHQQSGWRIGNYEETRRKLGGNYEEYKADIKHVNVEGELGASFVF